MYICGDLTPQVILSHSDAVFDTLIVHIKQLDIAVYITYRPPDAPYHMDKLERCLTKIEFPGTLEQHISLLASYGRFQVAQMSEALRVSGLPK